VVISNIRASIVTENLFIFGRLGVGVINGDSNRQKRKEYCKKGKRVGINSIQFNS
jgi:hypothetical protein